jgi:hypothetical protein
MIVRSLSIRFMEWRSGVHFGPVRLALRPVSVEGSIPVESRPETRNPTPDT